MYRSEIDGLRAVAVVPVILFHAGFHLFNGGFVGVDVFFVISGYLITSLLIADLDNKRFSIWNFYERRARRLLPALFFVMMACIPLAWELMLPDPLENFGQSLVATTLFSNNVLLSLTEADYWEVKAIYKPLLHTWSLGVEEQFYLLFPVFLVITWRFGKKNVFATVIFLTLVSLCLSVWSAQTYTTLNFYMLPTRAWELLTGSLAAFYIGKYNVQKNDIVALIGLAAIIFSVFAYDETLPFPSAYTLVPVTGAVLIIIFAETQTRVAKFLSSKILVGIGLISYSAYLWHQPIIAFVRIYSNEKITVYQSIAVIFFTLLLSLITWRFIEKPFRNSKTVSTPVFLSLSSIFMALILTTGLYFHFSNGAPQRIFTETSYARSTHEISLIEVESISPTQFILSETTDSSILLLGDSFVLDTARLILSQNPAIEFKVVWAKSDAEQVICSNALLERLSVGSTESVLIAFDEGFDIACLNNFITTLTMNEIDLLFIGTKQFGENLNWLARKNLDERRSLCQRPTMQKVKIDLNDKAAIPPKHYFSFLSKFADDDCLPITDLDGNLLSSDRQHLTIAGVEYFGERFYADDKIQRLLKRAP